jgi:hypothetical protein
MSLTKTGVEKALNAIDKAKKAVDDMTSGNPKKNREAVLRYLTYASTNLKLARHNTLEAQQARKGDRK